MPVQGAHCSYRRAALAPLGRHFEKLAPPDVNHLCQLSRVQEDGVKPPGIQPVLTRNGGVRGRPLQRGPGRPGNGRHGGAGNLEHGMDSAQGGVHGDGDGAPDDAGRHAEYVEAPGVFGELLAHAFGVVGEGPAVVPGRLAEALGHVAGMSDGPVGHLCGEEGGHGVEERAPRLLGDAVCEEGRGVGREEGGRRSGATCGMAMGFALTAFDELGPASASA